MAQAYKDGINKVKNKDFPTSLQSLEILIHTGDVENLDPRFGHLRFNQNRNGRSLRSYCIDNGIDYKWLTEYKKTYSSSKKPEKSSPVGFTSLDVIDEKVSLPVEEKPKTWSVSHLALSSPSGDIIEIIDACFVDASGKHFGSENLRIQKVPKKTKADIEHFAYLMS